MFFGCIDRPGHYLWDTESARVPTFGGHWYYRLDGMLVPRARDGRFTLHHLYDDTVTVLAFVDRSIDSRPNSNGAFIVEGASLTREQMIALAIAQFPNVAKRVGVVAAPVEDAK